jgi:hypothetical protein
MGTNPTTAMGMLGLGGREAEGTHSQVEGNFIYDFTSDA